MTTFLDSFGHTKESIDTNYTDDRWFIVLEDILFNGIGIVIEHSRLYEDKISRILATDTKKKLYGTEKRRFEGLALAFFHSPDSRLELLREMRINRALLLGPLQRFAECATDYLDAVMKDRSGQAGDMRARLMLRDRGRDIATPLQLIRDCITMVHRVRDMFLEKWHRLLLTMTHRFIRQYPNIAEDDIAGFCYGALISAFNKFDHEKGTFASLVQRQMGEYSRKSIVMAEVGNAFSLSLEMRKAVASGECEINNIAQTFPDEEAMETFMDELMDASSGFGIEEMSHDEEAESMQGIVERVDSEGWFRLLSGLDMDYEKVYGLWQ